MVRPVSIVLAGVEIDPDVDRELRRAGAPFGDVDRLAWLRSHGLQLLAGEPGFVGLVLAQGPFRHVGPVSDVKAKRLMAIARERLQAVGIDREPHLILRSAQLP